MSISDEKFFSSKNFGTAWRKVFSRKIFRKKFSEKFFVVLDEKIFRERGKKIFKQPGIRLATQDKYIVKRKHALEIASFEWCSSDQALAMIHVQLLFYKQNI